MPGRDGAVGCPGQDDAGPGGVAGQDDLLVPSSRIRASGFWRLQRRPASEARQGRCRTTRTKSVELCRWLAPSSRQPPSFQRIMRTFSRRCACRAARVARPHPRAFAGGCPVQCGGVTRHSQEDGVDQKLSVFHLFSELFPEYANDKDRDGGTTGVCLCTVQRMPAGSVGPVLACHQRTAMGDAAGGRARTN